MRFWVGLLLIILMIIPMSCRPAEEVPVRTESVIELAEEFITLLASEDFPKAVEMFDKDMKAALPEKEMVKLWASLQEEFGPFKGQSFSHTDETQGYDLVFITCEFQKAALDARIVFNAKKQIAGLFFQPSESSYTVPPYVDFDLFEEMDVTVGDGDFALPGTLSMPKGEGPFPAVVLVHGSGPNDRDESIGPNKPFRDLAYGLASRGIAVLRYDKRTLVHAEKMLEQAASVTVWEETVEDALRAVSLLKGTAGIDADRIYVAGHSLGATLAPRIGLHDKDLAGLILLAAAARPLEDLILEQYEYIFSLEESTAEKEQELEKIRAMVARVKDPELKAETPDLFGVYGAYWLDLRDYEPARVAAQLELPLFIQQGERDYQVTMTDYAIWQEALAGRENASFKSYPRLNHLFIQGEGQSQPNEYMVPGNVDREVIEDIAAWILAFTKE